MKQLNQQCQAKQQQAARLRAEAKRLTSPADFAASAKLQRQAVALEAECLKLEEDKVRVCSSPPVIDPISCVTLIHTYGMFQALLAHNSLPTCMPPLSFDCLQKIA